MADFTYLRCWQGTVFFSFVLDVFSRRVVGWQFASHMRTDLVLDALRMALTRHRYSRSTRCCEDQLNLGCDPRDLQANRGAEVME